MKYIPITVPNFSQNGCQTELVIAIDKSGSISKGFINHRWLYGRPKN